ncbi:MAG: cellulose biosynthesis protein BcsN [Rhizobium pusense]|nr:cellulose biosynthesis protein BcsN [Agrobacterium pusense]
MKFSAYTSLLFSIAVLSGCNTPAGVRSFGGTQLLSPSEALIFPPPGGPEIVTVVSRTYSNAVAQQVILRSEAATPGQNYLKAEFFGPQQAGDTDLDSLAFTGFRASSLAREIRGEFPGETIAMSANYLQNSYGAFSYAAGKGRGEDTCLYGWQDIRSPESMRQDFRNLGRIKVRLRLCQSGASIERLLAVEEVPMRPGGEVTASVPVRPVRRAAATAPVQPEQQPPPPVAAVNIPSPVSAGASGQPAVTAPRATGGGAVTGQQQSSRVPQVSIPSPSCLSGSGAGQGCR